MMYRYAQTNVQLFNQLRSNSYSDTELSLIFKAYELAMRLFAGCFRDSIGKTLIAHLVGTASILSSLDVPVKLVAAGLLHAAYDNGDFGNGEKGLSGANREQVRHAVGKEVEEYIARYTTVQWRGNREIPILREDIDALSSTERDVLLMRLANELEEYLNQSILYCSEKKRVKRIGRINRDGHLMMKVAQKLGFPTLAAELEQVFKEALHICQDDAIRKCATQI